MKKFKVGLQLYSIRDEMEKDMDKALEAVKEMGYDHVEFAGYFGKSADEINGLLKKHGLSAISVHQAPSLFWEDGQAAVDYLKDIGVKYCAIPHYSVDEYFNNWSETVEKFTALGKTMRENGIQLLYHNHDFEFEKIDGEFILDKLYESIPDGLLEPEFDTCWIRYAGNDPCEYLKKYKGRINVVHLKDFVCEKFAAGPVYALIKEDGTDNSDNSSNDNGFKFVPIGCGVQDWKSILEASEEAGAEYVIVEQDQSPDRNPLEAAKMSREYLKNTFGI